MSREVVLATMVLVLCGAGAWLASWIPTRHQDPGDARISGRSLERRAWRRIWLTMLPASLAFATLVGWAIQEPSVTDEPLRPVVILVALPAALLWSRCGWRAVLALRTPVPMPPIATVGIARPRIVIASDLREALDAEALAAAIAHEQVHVRRRDPLRIWLAQIATDLQWPSPSARHRLHRWLASLELARDEEARLAGASGEALAAAIVAVARMPAVAVAAGTAVAGLTGAEISLVARIRRLLDPLPPDVSGWPILLPLAAIVSLAIGVVVGAEYGDHLLRALPFIAA